MKKITSFSFNKKYLTRKEMIRIIENVTGLSRENITVVFWAEKKKRKKHVVIITVEY